jgi:hypothetical protein
MAKTKDKVVGAAGTAKPYVDRAIHDEALRDNVRTAFTAARDIYSELARGRSFTGVAHKVASDADIQGNLRTAVEELRKASNRLQGTVEEEQRKARHRGLLLLGVTLAALFNPVTGPSFRSWLKNVIPGGKDDEFGHPASGNGTS